MGSKTMGYQNHVPETMTLDLTPPPPPPFPMTKTDQTSLKVKVSRNTTCSPYHLGCLDFTGDISNLGYACLTRSYSRMPIYIRKQAAQKCSGWTETIPFFLIPWTIALHWINEYKSQEAPQRILHLTGKDLKCFQAYKMLEEPSNCNYKAMCCHNPTNYST
jgi:hypothetical protein